jgi:hypothetical protein
MRAPTGLSPFVALAADGDSNNKVLDVQAMQSQSLVLSLQKVWMQTFGSFYKARLTPNDG